MDPTGDTSESSHHIPQALDGLEIQDESSLLRVALVPPWRYRISEGGDGVGAQLNEGTNSNADHAREFELSDKDAIKTLLHSHVGN